MKLKIYGCRGSIAFSHKTPSRYGGNTSCIRLDAGDRTVILDAGSGILQLEADLRAKHLDYPKKPPIDILLSHLHMDHIIGLTTFAPIWDEDANVCIFTNSRGDQSLKSQVFGAFKPPYWPVSIEEATQADVISICDGVPFNLGALTVTPFYANHPDGTLSFRITDGSKTLVYMLDCEIASLSEEKYSALVEYCKHADAIIFDATYNEKDYRVKRDWGHSTPEHGVKLANDCGCKQMIFAHFSHEYSDDTLDGMLRGLNDENRFLFAYDGMEIVL